MQALELKQLDIKAKQFVGYIFKLNMKIKPMFWEYLKCFL